MLNKLIRMNRSCKLVSVFACVAFFCISCGKDAFDYGKGELVANEGEIEFCLDAAYSTVTKGDSEDLNLDVNEFTVEIFNSANVKIKKWDKFSDVSGQKVKLNTGTYKVKAFYGDSTATGFDAVYFAGSSSFQVEGQTTKTISVTCKQANVKMKINWGDQLVADYSDYTVKAYRPGYADSLTFIKTETKCGYIPAGDIRLRIYLTGKDGSIRAYSPAAITCAANDFITLTINTKPEATNEVSVTFSIDSATDDKTVTITIPAALVAKDDPQLSTSNFDGTRKLTFIEGIGAASEIGINAPGYIKSIVLKTSSPYLSSLGWPAEVDLIAVDAATSAKLKELGLTWLENVKDKKWGLVNFTELSKKLRYVEGADNDNVFTICVTDAYNQTTGEIPYTFAVQQARVSLAEIPAYDMWSTKAFANVTTNVDESLLKIEASVDGGTSWTEVPYTVLSTTGESRNVQLTLQPSTGYVFRGNYADGIKLSNTVTGTTENGKVLENGNMDTWSNTSYTTYGLQTIYKYFAGSSESDKYWGTRNTLTMNAVEDGTSSGTSNQVTAYRWNSCTIQTNDAVSGSAAEIRTMALATVSIKGSEVGSGLFWANKDIESVLRPNHNVYAGYLYTGEDVTFLSPDPNTLGITHDSRPESLTFSYKYAPYNGDKCKVYAKVYNSAGVEIAATNEFSTGAEQSGYISTTLNFTYTSLTEKAASIFIMFQSGINEEWSYVKFVDGSYNANPWSLDTWVGSILKIDDVKLNY